MSNAFRVAVIGSPRSGNTWLRGMLAHLFAAEQVAAHTPAELPPLPNRAAVQIHWLPEPPFLEYLSANAVRVVALARHPLDVVVSALHFAQHEPQTARWLDGTAAAARLVGLRPTAAAFLDYARSPAAASLLGVSAAWWDRPGVVRVKYEDLCGDPARELARLAAGLEHPADPEAVAAAVAAVPFAGFAGTWNRHGWRGVPDNWKTFLTPDAAAAIRDAHPHLFDPLGYAVGGYSLTRRAADSNWDRLRVPPPGEPPRRSLARRALGLLRPLLHHVEK